MIYIYRFYVHTLIHIRLVIYRQGKSELHFHWFVRFGVSHRNHNSQMSARKKSTVDSYQQQAFSLTGSICQIFVSFSTFILHYD